ncbi:MAG: FlgD immunoglobulin-like domain containing protein [Acidobacteriota bacterium]
MLQFHPHTITSVLFALALCMQSAAAQHADALCVQGWQNDAVVLAGTARNGIYRSTDGGVSWKQTGLREGSVYAIAVDPRAPAHWYAGGNEGLFASTDTGATWWQIDASIRASSILAPDVGPRLLLAADGSCVRRTTDDGKSWNVIEALTPYDIRMLSTARTDSGALYVAACDTAILLSSEKKEGVWTKLPALPQSAASPIHITALMCDTLSRTGASIIAGTDAGAFAYSLVRGSWKPLGTGLPSGFIAALGSIIYDTTSASRSYSLCVSVEDDRRASPMPRSVLCKLSSVSGSLDEASGWKPIADEAVSIRGCFMPDRGANRGKIYLAVSDGLRISYDGGTTWMARTLEAPAIAVVPSRSYCAGIVGQDGSSSVFVRIGNRGERALALRLRSITGGKNFSLLSPQELSLGQGEEGSFVVKFSPVEWGKQTAQLVVETSDPLLPLLFVDIAGFNTGRASRARTVVIDRTHGARADGRLAAIAEAFTRAGMHVEDSLAAPMTDAALVILPGPVRRFTDAEALLLAQAAARGASIAALGGADDSSASVLNALFASAAWKTAASDDVAIRFAQSRITSAAGSLQAWVSFALRSAPLIAHASVFGFASATEVLVSGGNADTLCSARGVTRTDGDGSVHAGVAAALGAVARVGKGNVIAIGDPLFWSADTIGMPSSGLWAGDNFNAALSIASSVEGDDIAFPLALKSEEYMLFSIPYALKNGAAASVCSAFGKPDPYQWRLFGAWNSLDESYSEYPSPAMMSIERGKAYWLISRSVRPITPGEAAYSLIAEPFTMKLDPGFTLIGDPFPFPVEWKSAVASSGGVEPAVWMYEDHQFVPTHMLHPYKGYFVCNASDSAVVVTLMPRPASDTAAEQSMGKSAQAEGEWMMSVAATDGIAADGGNACGMLQSSSDWRDVNDRSEPPLPPGRFVSFRFTEKDARPLAVDCRSVHADGAFWNCEVRSSSPGTHVRLAFSQKGTLPRGFGLYLVDYETERVTGCAGTASYEFTMKPNETRRLLRIVAGSDAYVERHTDGIPVTPLSYALAQNYPNPWNPSTTIAYTLAHSDEVDLSVFNVLGQKVRTLMHGRQSLGAHTCVWDGADDRGVRVASGIYVYRLTAGAYAESKRMVLVK